jgi:hypothetical protein
VDWKNVIPTLLQDSISFAIWNDHLPVSAKKDHDAVLHDPTRNVPLLTYSNYPLLVRRDVLDDIIVELPSDERERLSPVLLDGKLLSFEDFRKCAGLLQQLSARRVGFVAETDIADAAALAGLHSSKYDLNRDAYLSTDRAVQLLVDGEISAAILGGLQESYLTRRFPNDLICLTQVPHQTKVRLWFNDKTYNERYSEITPVLFSAWEATMRIWERVKKETKEPRQSSRFLSRWVESLALKTNIGVEVEGNISVTPIYNVTELVILSDNHDELGAPKNVGTHGDLTNVVQLRFKSSAQ